MDEAKCNQLNDKVDAYFKKLDKTYETTIRHDERLNSMELGHAKLEAKFDLFAKEINDKLDKFIGKFNDTALNEQKRINGWAIAFFGTLLLFLIERFIGI